MTTVWKQLSSPRRATVVSAWMLLVALSLATTATAGLRQNVENAIRGSKLPVEAVSVSIRDCDSGVGLAEFLESEPRIPASNLKLYTSGAALHVLRADFQFQTRMQLFGDNLVILGDGDPAFGDPDLLDLMAVPGGLGMDFEMFIDHWVRPIIDSGRTSINEIIVDDRIFDREWVNPNWPAKDLNRSYAAEVSGFNFHRNIIRVRLEPTSSLPRKLPVPRIPNVTISNKATCNRDVHDRSTAWIARQHMTNKMTLYGNVKFANSKPIDVTFHDAPLAFAQVLADRISRAGVEVKNARAVSADELFENPVAIGPVIRTPIATVVTRCNRDSENIYAEALLKRVGFAITRHAGSRINGAAIVRQVAYERLDEPALVKDLIIDDGSGLSRKNRITAAATTDWLNSFESDPELSSVYINSLASAGKTGTLRKRFSKTDLTGVKVQAKTGYINGVSCLSGYVTADNGHRRSFSILANGLNAPGQVRLAKRLQERIVGLIAEDLRSRVNVTRGGS